jgi:adenine/guanine phosphoribosyltransferase-like PRPP-binding protein
LQSVPSIFGNGAETSLTNFSRKGKVKIGHDDTTLEQAIDELVYTADGAESGIKSLLIVDESSASGRTAAAVLHHIREAGLTASCEVTVVVWAKLGE